MEITAMIGNQLHTLSYLKQVTGTRVQEAGVPHVLALAPRDAISLELTLIAVAAGHDYKADMRSWRPRDGWAISRTDQRWLHIPNGYVIVHRAEVS
jgi:hypothetical protein